MKDHLDKVSFLTQDDLNFMYEQAFLFQEWKRGLVNMFEIANELSTPHFSEQQYNVSMELKKEMKYTKRKLLRELEEKMDSIASGFVYAIEWHLEKKYGMDIVLKCTDEIRKESNWKEQDYIQEIIRQLQEQFGQENADNIQLQQLADKVLKKEPKQNGKVLEFPSQYSHAWRLVGSTIRTDFIEEILLVVCYQDHKTFELPERIKILLSCNYEESILPHLPSVEKYKVFKNGKMTVTFSSSDALSNFMKLLEENKTKENK